VKIHVVRALCQLARIILKNVHTDYTLNNYLEPLLRFRGRRINDHGSIEFCRQFNMSLSNRLEMDWLRTISRKLFPIRISYDGNRSRFRPRINRPILLRAWPQFAVLATQSPEMDRSFISTPAIAAWGTSASTIPTAIY